MSKTQSELVRRLKTAIAVTGINNVKEYLNKINLKIVENPEELLFDAARSKASKDIFRSAHHSI